LTTTLLARRNQIS